MRRFNTLVARVAQLVEHQIVILRVAGSYPVSCPIFFFSSVGIFPQKSENRVAVTESVSLCAVVV